MQANRTSSHIALALSKEEALVLCELLQRIVEEDEKPLLPLLHSSAEFAVLCRLNNNLEKVIPELFYDHYDDLIKTARTLLIKESGHFEGISEQ